MFKPGTMTKKQLKAALIARTLTKTCELCGDLSSVQFNEQSLCGPCAAETANGMMADNRNYGKKITRKSFTLAKRIIKEMKKGEHVHVK